MDLEDYKTYKHKAQDIYNILYTNKEVITITNSYVLCSYSKLSDESKQAIKRLFINNNDIINNNTVSSYEV